MITFPILDWKKPQTRKKPSTKKWKLQCTIGNISKTTTLREKSIRTKMSGISTRIEKHNSCSGCQTKIHGYHWFNKKWKSF